MRIVIPNVPPSQNEWDRLNYAPKGRYVKKTIKKKWLRYYHNYGFLWKAHHQNFARKVAITFCFDNKIRHDKDNYAYFKPILDGLVQQGIIKDDNTGDVKTTHKIILGAKNRETIIEIEE